MDTIVEFFCRRWVDSELFFLNAQVLLGSDLARWIWAPEVRVPRNFRVIALPWLGLAVACATGVDPDVIHEPGAGSGGNPSGGTQSSNTAGSSSPGGQLMTIAGKPSGGSAGSGGANPSAGNAGAGTGGAGAPGASGGSSGLAGTGSLNGGAGAGGAPSGGTTATGGGGTNGGGTNGGGTNGGGTNGGGGATNGGGCAPADSGWVVQFWTTSAASSMPTGDYRIFNNSGGSVTFSALELRHYFTNEETATLSFIFPTFGHNLPASPYYEDENGANVLSSIVPLVPAVVNAAQYISIKFNEKPGAFNQGEYAQLGFYSSLSMYPSQSSQANDHTYLGHPTADPGSANKNTGWSRVTLYESGELVWGCEP